MREWKQPEGGGGGGPNPPDPDLERVLEAAKGYFQLAMWEDAWNELERLVPRFRHLPRVWLLLVLIFNHMGRWEYAVVLGKEVLRQYPHFSAMYLAAAHALRHYEGAAAARAVLVAGEALLKEEGVYHFLLATYECQLGDLESAKAEVERACEMDGRFRSQALDEADLEALWESM